MRKRKAIVLLAMIAVMAVATPVAMAAEPQWKYTEDGKTGLVVYAPREEQRLYMHDNFTLDFGIKMGGRIVTDVRLVKRYEPETTVKSYDVLNAAQHKEDSSRYSIQLGLEDVPEGSYTLIFTVKDASGKKLVETRTVYVTAGRWDVSEGKWYYYMDGSYVKNSWKLIAEKWYHFRDSGAMDTKWQKINGKWYWFGEDGTMRTGWQKINGKWYCFNNDGIMFVNAWIKIGNKWYMVDTDGVMLTGWQKDRGNWYYMDTNTGLMQTGWMELDGKWYYLGSNGAMYTGTHIIDNVSYTFDKNGVRVETKIG